ncbi:MAG: hypothetical protein GF313_03545 [Caldithrix sp.]|nr:hypothetical protein [Caldithrix sp.]
MKRIVWIVIILGVSLGHTWGTGILTDAEMDSIVDKANAFIIEHSYTFHIHNPTNAKLNVEIRMQINSEKAKNTDAHC